MGAALTDRDLLARLVAFESVSRCDNQPIVDFVCEYVDRPGVDVTRIADPDGVSRNVVASTGMTDDDRGGLVLSGHLDVVPADEPDWESDPFTLVERDGAYFARGACDMKGFVAISMNRLVRSAGTGNRQPLALVLTDGEELGSLGAQRLAEAWADHPPLPRAAVIGEPTSLRAVRMHKGHLTMRIVTGGAAAHSGSPQLGRNAIEAAGHVLDALRSLREKWETRRSETSEYFHVVPYPVLNVARIEGGGALNVVPDQCTIDLGIRALPGQDPAALASEVDDCARSAAGGESIAVTVLNNNPPMLLRPGAPIHEALQRLVRQRESVGVSFSSDAGVLQRSFGMEAVLFGPGTIEVAHRPNEFVPIEEFGRAGAVVDELIQQFCTEGSSA